MAILIGIALACGVLFIWLTGHWFGRVLAFIVFAVLFGGLGGMATAHGVDPLVNILTIIGGIALGWPVSSIPIYVAAANNRRVRA